MAEQYKLQAVLDALNAMEGEWASLCSNPDMGFARERDWVLAACEKSDSATKTANGDIGAVQNALRNCAAVGLTLDPAQKLAYVLPRDSKMVYDVSYMGLMEIGIRSGAIMWAQARVVHEHDTFELDGYDRPPVHKFKPFAKAEVRGAIEGAYVVVKTSGGDYLTNAMQVDDINAIRARSPAWKNRDVNKPTSGGPWATDWDEMAKKTCVKNGYKYWPRSPALDRAINYLNTEGGQGIDLTPADATKTLVDYWTSRLKGTRTREEAATMYDLAKKACKDAEDMDAYNQLRDVAMEVSKALPPPADGTPKATPAPTPTPTPTPTTAPAARRTAAPKPDPATAAMAAINSAETDADLEATGALIDALTDTAAQELCNVAYNTRLTYLDKKFMRTGG